MAKGCSFLLRQLLLWQFIKKIAYEYFNWPWDRSFVVSWAFMWDKRERAIYMGKHLLMNAPVVRSISGMWLLTPEIKIPTEAWISLQLWAHHEPGITLTLNLWDARHMWVQLEWDSMGSTMTVKKVHKYLQRKRRMCSLGGKVAKWRIWAFFFPNSVSSIHPIHLS